MKNIQWNRLLLTFGVICLSTGTSFAQAMNDDAQDTLVVTMNTLYFEYDENGAVVKEFIDEEELEDEATEELAKRRSAGIMEDKEEHLLVNNGTSAGVVTVVVDQLADAAECTLEVYSLSGIRMFSADIQQPRTIVNLGQLPKGVYVISLSLDGRKETKTIILK